MHGLTSRSLSLIAESKMAMLIGDGFRRLAVSWEGRPAARFEFLHRLLNKWDSSGSNRLFENRFDPYF